MNNYEATETYKVLFNDESRTYIRASRQFIDWYRSYWKAKGYELVTERGKDTTTWRLEQMRTY